MSLWREIADALVRDIDNGILQPGAQLTSDADLGRRFGVNRHTIRRALSFLGDEGLIRSQRGKGTFVVESALSYRLGAKTKFEENLLEMSKVPHRTMLHVSKIAPTDDIAKKLNITTAQSTISFALLGSAGDVPIQIMEMYLQEERFPHALERLNEIDSDNVLLSHIFVSIEMPEYRRAEMVLRSRMPTEIESNQLKMAKTDPVTETRVVAVDALGRPVYFCVTTFCSSRVDFILDV
ncbi:phosphonate metabolism transcriptional regulator PhnF [Sphingomonas sp. DT-204]|uniref:phosphonate metabolism transcriptional regulator PhnF n=1 Tax=Sphingomonas sp. DT-204 TaxID=3396166 RepID=UPI003F1B3948